MNKSMLYCTHCRAEFFEEDASHVEAGDWGDYIMACPFCKSTDLDDLDNDLSAQIQELRALSLIARRA